MTAARRGYYRTRWTRATRQLRQLPQALSLAWRAAPGWTAAWVLLLVAQGLLPAALVYLTRAVVNAVVALGEADITPEHAGPVVALVALAGGLLLLGEVLSAISGYVRVQQAERITDHVSDRLQNRSLAVDLAFYDFPESYDHLHRARNEANYRPLALLESLGSLLQNIVTLGAMTLVILPYGAWLPVALLISTAPAILAVLRGTRRYHEWYVRTTADQRRAWYLDWLTADRSAAAEVRLFEMGPGLREGYRALRLRLRGERLALAREEATWGLAAGATGIGVTAVTLGVLLWQTLTGLLGLGDLALLYQAFSQGQGLLRSALGHVGQIYRNSLFLGDLVTFLALEPTVTDPVEPVTPEAPSSAPAIRFRDLSFGYAGGRGLVFEHFDLELPAGRVVAIVGRNGSGKSTLVKLLCRFYDPEAGSVELDGVDLRHLRLADLRRRITVLFQVPLQLAATVRQNIGAALPDTADGDVVAAARRAGVDDIVAGLPEGYDTLLGVWFPGGTDLSVGEWQRIALARAYLRPAPIMVLDEPTSAMDPWAEAEWYRRFHAVTQGRTVLLITHRFTTARFADLIHVMDDGRVVESGTHDELLARGGDYARCWREQMAELRPGATERVP